MLSFAYLFMDLFALKMLHPYPSLCSYKSTGSLGLFLTSIPFVFTYSNLLPIYLPSVLFIFPQSGLPSLRDMLEFFLAEFKGESDKFRLFLSD